MRLHIPVSLRWSDLDAYQHVNNVEMFGLLQEARITAFWKHDDAEEPWPTAVIETGPGAPSHTFVAHQEIEYLRPLAYTRTPVRVELWIGKIGGASLDVCYELHDGAPRFERLAPTTGDEPYVRAVTTIVLVDAGTGKPRRISAEERTAWEGIVEEPLKFRRR
ncbi:acyl-CoA thioesterase [Antribacter gilvus]|uniref:acyl-CoA thioesterase n=1 Tax=Antribacter gilvus TaxID=2304675 RepID=UPI000F7AC708|nr:thioesterase family protein [Antribacter gilvus]